VAGRLPPIDLKLRLTLRVAALAAVCFVAVAPYALFDSDRIAKGKASRIAEIVARDLSLQQSQAQWLSVSINRTPDLQRVAALMEPGLCIAHRDNAGAFLQGVCSGAPADETVAPEIFAVLYRAIFRPGEPVSMPMLIAGNARGTAVATFDPAMLLAEKSVDEIADTLHISVKTAANTRYQIRAKLGVGSDIELVRLALRQRIIAAEDMGS
jgi:hypothetical protein